MQQNNSSSSPHQLLICGLAILIFEILTIPLLRLGHKNDEELIFAMWFEDFSNACIDLSLLISHIFHCTLIFFNFPCLKHLSFRKVGAKVNRD
jgi:hypothetical protein